ncbi:MAG TPA: neocarzinostatin apoprotein domain-containing protein [Acidimicrobiales bacterium]
MRYRTVGLVTALAGVALLAAACTPVPAVSVAPSTGLTDGQVVTVIGSGYSPSSTVGIVQCRAGASAIDQCDGRTADSFSTDAAGRYTRSMTVYARVTDAHGVSTDCASAPGACIVASVYVHGFQGLATAPLTFAT